MKRLTRRQAIKEKCLDCTCGQINEVRQCPANDCPLFPFRLGTEDPSFYDDDVRQTFIQERELKQKNARERGGFGAKNTTCDEEAEQTE